MKRQSTYGPALVLAAVIVAAVLGGPAVMRQYAHAEEQARIIAVRQQMQSSRLAELSESFKLVARAVEPSVVHISVSSKSARTIVNPPRNMPEIPDELRRFFPGLPDRDSDENDNSEQYDEFNAPRQYGSGSGWVYGHGDKKYIITNNHVVKGADEITVKFFDKSERQVEIVGTDPQTDIAVLEIENGDLHPAELAQASVEQGEIIFAFGSPFQFEFSMSQGIVSGSGRRLGILGQMGYENFIQTDAAINPGNSGGPLTNIYGEVVGMNTAIATRTGGNQGIGFAIPVDMIRQVVDQLIEKGKVSRGYLGVWIRDLDPKIGKTFGYDGDGVLVEDMVDKQSPAAKAGVQAGDIITQINGKPVASASQLRRIVAAFAPGEKITMQVFRSGKNHIYEITLTEQPTAPMLAGRAAPGRMEDETENKLGDDVSEGLKKFGIEKLATLTEEAADRLEMEFEPGVIVEQVRSGSMAASQGLRPGVVILEVQGEKVENIKQFGDELAKHKLVDGVRLRVRLGEVKRFVLLQLPD